MLIFSAIAWALVIVVSLMAVSMLLAFVSLYKSGDNTQWVALRNRILRDVKAGQFPGSIKLRVVLKWAALSLFVSWASPLAGAIFVTVTIFLVELPARMIYRKGRDILGLM